MGLCRKWDGAKEEYGLQLNEPWRYLTGFKYHQMQVAGSCKIPTKGTSNTNTRLLRYVLYARKCNQVEVIQSGPLIYHF